MDEGYKFNSDYAPQYDSATFSAVLKATQSCAQGCALQVDTILDGYREDGETILDSLRRLVDEYNVLFDSAVEAYDNSIAALGAVGVELVDASEPDGPSISADDSIIWGS